MPRANEGAMAPKGKAGSQTTAVKSEAKAEIRKSSRRLKSKELDARLAVGTEPDHAALDFDAESKQA